MPYAKNGLNSGVQSLSILIIGLGVGWLSGLSISPVIAQVLGALLGIGGGIVVGMRAYKTPNSEPTEARPTSVDAFPAALLVLGIALGAPLGIIARTHGVFDRGGFKTELKPLATVFPSGQGAAVLYDSHTTECGKFLGAEDQDATLRARMLDSNSPWAKILADKEKDPGVLKSVMESICAP